jgi:hypothetical protein
MAKCQGINSYQPSDTTAGGDVPWVIFTRKWAALPRKRVVAAKLAPENKYFREVH